MRRFLIQKSRDAYISPYRIKNSFNDLNALVGSMARTVLSQSIGIDNTFILIEHRNKAEINNPLDNRIFKGSIRI